MEAIVSPGFLKGTIIAPASKSMMQRVCAAALLRQGVTTIKNPGKSDDDIVALDIIGQLGAKIVHQTDASLTIASEGLNNSTNSINCDESGLSARLFTPIAALLQSPSTVTSISFSWKYSLG